MEIKLKQGDRIAIPDGCTATINGNEVVIEKKEQEFKDGDIIAKMNAVVILRGNFNNGVFRDYACINFDGNVLISNGIEWSTMPAGWHIATEEERQLLFDKMEEQGLRWNAEDKQVEKIRWRAKEGEDYYCITERGHVVGDEEGGLPEDIERYEFGNYFRTREQAEQAADAVKMALMKFHEENE